MTEKLDPMSTIITTIRKRRKTRERADHRLQQSSQRVGIGCGFALSLLLIFLIFSFVLSYRSLTNDLPDITEIESLLNPRNGSLLQPTRIYDRSGERLIRVFAPEDAPRRYLPLSPANPQHLPESLANATLALTDADFWTHPGYSLDDLSNPESHPTLTQKLVADLLLWDEAPSLRRALRERMLAAQLTDTYGRQQILEWYLNSADYGNHAYGAEAAAQLYFDKSATELNAAESATLAAISQSPALNPLDAPIAAYQRRQETLYVMESLEMLDADEAESARRSPFDLSSPNEAENPAPAFTRYLIDQLDKIYPRERIERGGLTIISSLDLAVQEDAACLVQAQVKRLGGRDAANCPVATPLPALPLDEAKSNVHASAVILDPRNGQILAAVGETDLNGESTQLAPHKIGSGLSPFIYLTGLTRGLNPASLLWDIPSASGLQNFDGEFHGPMRLRIALANDYRVPLESVLAQMGAENVNKTARSFGLDVDMLNAPDAELSPLDVAAAYSVFAAEGMKNGQTVDDDFMPLSVLRVEDADGEIWLNWETPQSQAVVSPQLAFLMNDMLRDETARWASLGASNALTLERPAAAKLGQVADKRSAWTIGYTPQRVAVAWMGAEEEFSPKVTAGLWNALLENASADLPPENWDAPVGISRVDVCDPSGLLPTAACPNIISEVFLNGSEPSQYDHLYRRFEVNRETGYLATVFTPLALVEEKTYLVVPPEAKAWADSAGIETPPTAYDAILAPPRLADAYLTEPELFADVHGKVALRGTAAGEGFQSYRVQVGKGLNPQKWLQIGEEMTTPVEDGLLMTWDTRGLSGLYALQLLVLRADDRVDIVTTQVSIDNEPPTMKILYPQEGDVIKHRNNRQLEFQVEANDNLGIESVDFYLDFQQIGAAVEAPYAWTWATEEGKHRLRVVARDRAGNTVEKSIRFEVKR